MHKHQPHLHTDVVAEMIRHQKIIFDSINIINQHLETLKQVQEEDQIGDMFAYADDYPLEAMLCEIPTVGGAPYRILIITKAAGRNMVGKVYAYNTKDPFDGKRHLFVKHERS